jgi:hypothetical protein
MPWYVITESIEIDWDDEHKYTYRYKSRNGSPVAQDKIERRRAAGRSAGLCRWENNAPTLVEKHNT